MVTEADIKELLTAKGVPLAGEVVRLEASDDEFFVFVRVVKDKEKKQEPSNKNLGYIANDLYSRGVTVHYVLVDADADDIEAGIRATILHIAGEKVRNAFLSIQGSTAHLWIVPKMALSGEDVEKIRSRSEIYLTNIDISLDRISYTNQSNIPTRTACLAVIRSIAPASPMAIIERLRRKKFDVPSENWMARMLDNLRKGGLIVRIRDGDYALTLNGLQSSGTTKGRKSPDVSRVLDLGRRRG